MDYTQWRAVATNFPKSMHEKAAESGIIAIVRPDRALATTARYAEWQLSDILRRNHGEETVIPLLSGKPGMGSTGMRSTSVSGSHETAGRSDQRNL